MQISSTPLKWTLPFAANDSAKVEIPATTTDATRFSLSLGSPPLTGQPPESGGVPPQLEDFNGAMNQVSRFVWWSMGGGPLPYDATWSADSNVNGYANGARIASADLRGEWVSTIDNNTVNPDTVGTNWVPGSAYGNTALTGQTGGTVTLTPAQAAKRTLSVAGALTSNLTLVLPTWLQEWTVTNTTTGAFTVTVKTAAGSGVVIPQNSAPTRVRGDGTNITQLAENVAAATSSTQPLQLGQATGRWLGVQRFNTAGTSTYTPTAGTTRIHVRVVGGGGGGGGSGGVGAGAVSMGGGGSGGSYGEGWYTTGFSGVTITVGAGGTAGTALPTPSAGGNGGQSSFGALLTAPGGIGGPAGTTVTPPGIVGSAGAPAAGAGGNVINAGGAVGTGGIAINSTTAVAGAGGASVFGGGGAAPGGTNLGLTGNAAGAGGSGGCTIASGAGSNGGAGQPGIVIIEEYA